MDEAALELAMAADWDQSLGTMPPSLAISHPVLSSHRLDTLAFSKSL